MCHTFLHVEQVKKPTAMQESSEKLHGDARYRVLSSNDSRFFDSRNVPKRATKSDTMGHCLTSSSVVVYY